ncbi:MAG: NnrU family protein [Rhodobacterales bacterium]
MILLTLGVFLWALAHYFKRFAPEARAALGNKGKGLVAVAIVVSLLMMIFGYRGAEYIQFWSPPSWTVHLNNLMMLVAVFVYGMSATTGRLRGKLRHPQLTAVKIWAVAHLLVNGHLAALILFGGLLAWAVGSVIMINRSEPWVKPKPGDPKKDILLVVITLVLFGVMTAIHAWLGVWPFPR